MSKLVRVNLALSKETMAQWDALAASQQASRTEVIRRSMTIYKWFIAEIRADNKIATIDPAGTITPREFLIL